MYGEKKSFSLAESQYILKVLMAHQKQGTAKLIFKNKNLDQALYPSVSIHLS